MIGWDCNRKMEEAMERNRKIAISAGVATTLAAGAIAFLAWRKGRDVMGRFKTWKKNKNKVRVILLNRKIIKNKKNQKILVLMK